MFKLGLAIIGFSALVALANCQSFTRDPTTREVEMFVNVYDHPKTGFTCAGKNPGQYYADPATKCAVYYVCIPNPTGTLSPQSFACPNGTIFSQATRVCRPHEEVFCPLATRFYDNVQGQIDTKEIVTLPVAPLILDTPVPQQPRRQSHTPKSKSQPQQQSVPQNIPLPQNLPPQPKPQPKPVPAPNTGSGSNLFNARFRNSRTSFGGASTTTTTVAPPPSQPLGPNDYEYDYSDYNETGLANAASSLREQLVEQINNKDKVLGENIANNADEPEQAESSQTNVVMATPVAPKTTTSNSGTTTTTTSTTSLRQKRQANMVDAEQWIMLNRRKGQLATEQQMDGKFETKSQTMANNDDDNNKPSVEFTCEDKLAEVAYADVHANCTKLYVCMRVAKGKLWRYHLSCEQGKRFNQMTGACVDTLDDNVCARSEHYYLYNKWHRVSKKQIFELAKKQQQQHQTKQM